MKKTVLILFLLMLVLSVFAGPYEDAVRTGRPVCLYIYTKTCKYCKQTNPVFERMAQNHRKICNFVRVDAESPYGTLLVRDLMVSYVPFVAFADARRQYFIPVAPTCALEYSCLEKEFKTFMKQ